MVRLPRWHTVGGRTRPGRGGWVLGRGTARPRWAAEFEALRGMPGLIDGFLAHLDEVEAEAGARGWR